MRGSAAEKKHRIHNSKINHLSKFKTSITYEQPSRQYDLNNMVKRKAEVSIDEWLRERGTQPDNCPEITAAAEGVPTRVDTPVATAVTESSPVELVSQAAADVATPIEEEAGWFWELLKAVGYEVW